MNAVSTARVADLTAELFGECTPGGVNSILRTLRALLGFAVEQGLLEKAPNVGRVASDQAAQRLAGDAPRLLLSSTEPRRPPGAPSPGRVSQRDRESGAVRGGWGLGVDFTGRIRDIASVTDRPTTHPKMTWATNRD